jgi:phosphomethylpyrimidine synthase
MRITQDLQRYAAEHGVSVAEAAQVGMAEKSVEFAESGGRVYLPVAP